MHQLMILSILSMILNRIFHGERGHGTVWKGYAHKAGRVFPELPNISRCHNYDIQYKYTYKCDMCHHKYVQFVNEHFYSISISIGSFYFFGSTDRNRIRNQRKLKTFVVAIVTE